MDASLKALCRVKETNQRGYILYESTVIIWRRRNYSDRRQISAGRGWHWEKATECKGALGNLVGDGSVLRLDCGGGMERWEDGLGLKSIQQPVILFYPLWERIRQSLHGSKFLAALFRRARFWKWPKCLTTDDGFHKVWFSQTLEFYSAINNVTDDCLLTW